MGVHTFSGLFSLSFCGVKYSRKLVLVRVTGFLFLGVGPSGVLSAPPIRARRFPLAPTSVGDMTTWREAMSIAKKKKKKKYCYIS